MKERWKLKRVDTLKEGDIFWCNNTAWQALRVTVSQERLICFIVVEGNGFIEKNPRDRLPVLLSRRDPTPPEAPTPQPSRIICEGGSPANMRRGRTVLGAPPVMPTPPPLRYEKQPDSVWQTLKDWLNGR